MASNMPQLDEEHVSVTCTIHSKESLELYCKGHELAICRLCKILKHKKCDVETITSAFQNVDVPKGLEEISTQIMTLGKALLTRKEDILFLLDKMNKDKNEMEESIENIRAKVNGMLDRYKEQLQSQVKSETELLTVNIEACESLSDQLGSQKATLDKVKGNNVQGMLALIEANDLYKEYNQFSEEMEKEIREIQVYIREDEILPDLIKELTSIGQKGTVESEEMIDEVDDKQGRTFLDIKSCNSEQEIDIKVPDDAAVPNVTGCCCLPNGGVIICDQGNIKLKILDQGMKIITFTLPCPEIPYDVVPFDDNSTVVLYASSFQSVMIKPGVMFQSQVTINWKCSAIGSLNKIVYISGYDCVRKKHGIAGFTAYGQIRSFVSLVGPEAPILESNMSLHVDGVDVCYLFLRQSRRSGYFINKLSSKGHGVFSICTASLKKPKSIISDTAGNMLICDTITQSVHIIDSEGQVGNAVLTEKDDFGPTSMCLNASKDMLVVASAQKDKSKITVYKVKYD